MAIVLNEYVWAERAIQNRDLGKKPTETLSRVARYYYENKYSRREIRRLIELFVLQCDPDTSLFYWSDTLDKIARASNKYPLIKIESIPVTRQEIETILTLGSIAAQKLAFTLLCVSKYWDIVSDMNNHWVNSKDKDIFKMANVTAPSQKQDLLFGSVIQAGLIKQSKRIDNLNVQVQFQDPGGECVLEITDFRNLGNQYLKYLGEPYFECEYCGLTVRFANASRAKKSCSDEKRGPRQRYCAACASEIKTRQSVEAMVRKRSQKISS